MEEIIEEKFKSEEILTEGIAIISHAELWTRLGIRKFEVRECIYENTTLISDEIDEFYVKELRQFVEDEEIESDTYILVNRIDNIITIRQEYKEQDILKINEWDLIGVA